MRRFCFVFGVGIALVGSIAVAQQPSAAGPYKLLRTAKVGGAGGFDYVYADVTGRRLYIPRSGASARITVFNLDTLDPTGEIPGVSAHGAAVDPKAHHGFATSKPLAMWDTNTLATIKAIDVQGSPDGILFDPFNERIYDFSHGAPTVTVINAADGAIVGTIDLGGAPEQAVTDGAGHLYVDLEDKDSVAVVDTKTMMVTAHYDLGGQGGTPAALAFDVKNHILFVACRKPQTMVMLNATTGKIITSLPIGSGVDGAAFNPNTMEAFSSQVDGTLTVIKENSPTSFAVEQTVQTMTGARTLTLDTKTNHILLITTQFGPAPADGRGRGAALPDSFSILVVGK
jgi:DNA-binding beta-propeller fold protein YncE